MIIVVEGPDNAGKTTVALELAKLFKAIFIKTENIPPQNAFLSEYSKILDAAVSYGNGWVVSDRHHAVSDMIYGPIIRGHTKLQHEDVTKAMAQVNAFVYCRPPNGQIIGSMPARPQMGGVIQNIQELIDTYDKFFAELRMRRQNVWYYDWTKDSPQMLAQEIKRYA